MDVKYGLNSRILCRRKFNGVKYVEIAYETRHHTFGRECVEVIKLTPQLSLRPKIVSIEKCDDLAPGHGNSFVARRAGRSGLALDHADWRALLCEARHDIRSPIDRPAIDDDDFSYASILSSDRGDGIGEKTTHIEVWNDHGDASHLARPPTNAEIVSTASIGSGPRRHS